MLEINENQGFKFLWQLRLDSLNPWGTGGFSESLSTVNCQLSTINYQLSTINYQLFNATKSRSRLLLLRR